jgi:hypothetical protein
MKTNTPYSKLFTSVALGLILAGNAAAASVFSVNYSSASTITKEADTYYNEQSGTGNGEWDQISTIFHVPVTTSDGAVALTSSLYGRNYDSDPCVPGSTGLLDRGTLTGFTDAPWLVKHGLAPVAVGSLLANNHRDGIPHPVEASYLAFKVCEQNGEAVMFDSAQLTITGLYNTDSDIQIWAATSGDGFGTAVIPMISADSDTDVYTFDFSGLNYEDACLEIRVYGVLGMDQGTFDALLQGVVIPPVALPEPSNVILLGFMGLMTCLRRRR